MKLSKNICALLLFLAMSVLTLRAQYVDIPDPVFRSWLEDRFPACMQAGQLDTTCTILGEIERFDSPEGIINLEGIQYFKALKILYYEFGQLAELPALPPTLENLWVPGNALVSLPELPVTLKGLNCDVNLLTHLPRLPGHLEYLACAYNRLTELPELPSSLYGLDCQGNQLVYLPELPDSLRGLKCSENKLRSLPPLPSGLFFLYCSQNMLTSLPALNEGIAIIDVSYNPNLRCFPPLPDSVGQFCFEGIPHVPPFCASTLSVEGTGISCLPELPGNMWVDTILPVCTDPGEYCTVIAYASGRIFLDLDGDGMFSADTDKPYPYQVVRVLPSGWHGVSDVSGNYWVKLDTGITNRWSLPGVSEYLTVSPSYHELTPELVGTQGSSFDFPLTLMPGINDLRVHIGGGPVRPGFTVNLHLSVSNVGTSDQDGIILKMKKPEGFEVLSAQPLNFSVVNDSIIWRRISLDLFSSSSFSVSLKVPVNAELGSEAVFEAWALSNNADNTPEDNYARWAQTVTGSFDPNDKLVDRDALSHQYTNDDRLLYTIRFQNTGTDTAFTVIVQDVIPDNLDMSSLQVVNASHPYQLMVREKNLVEIAFPNIRLPDSNRNEPASHGFVQLSLKPVEGLSINSEIINSAAIYFDFNDPIITDDVITTIRIISGISNNRELNFKIFPNPASQLLRVELPESIAGIWMISDITGRILQKGSLGKNSSRIEIPVSHLPGGIFMFTLQSGDEISSARFVIIR
jgi:uncharacterized repeat protein (TIGR01451 family)